MVLKGSNGEVYSLGREVGRGGEGLVYELRSHPELVLKQYNEPLDEQKIAKLRLMAAMRTPALDTHAAWPHDLIQDESNTYCGFVMRKLVGYVPLHMLFSPMERKKLFPTMGYNFLVHVARNLVAAFHKLHEAGVVAGDINEGNILVDQNGLVAFIDCDSFQIQSGDTYCFCEVGIPRYTPPELLTLGSFDEVIRTVNTDSFSISILVFQLLFMGRHPFAGVNKTGIDFDEVAAILNGEFAYSLRRPNKVLQPPENALSITNLPEGVARLFHRAFESQERPTPKEWIAALDELIGGIVYCTVDRVHNYPAQAGECPWCYFADKKGVSFFLDRSSERTKIGAHISHFINGFAIQELDIQEWSPPVLSAPVSPQVTGGFRPRLQAGWWLLGSLVLFAFLAFWNSQTLGGAVFGVVSMGAVFVVFLGIVYAVLRWPVRRNLKATRRELSNTVAALDACLESINKLAEVRRLKRSLQQLRYAIEEYRKLPVHLDIWKLDAEEQYYNELLNAYLQDFQLDDYEIASLGATRKSALKNHGINTAADIQALHTIKIPGIGPKKVQLLFDWQRQMAANFVYRPDPQELAAIAAKVTTQAAIEARKQEADITQQYQALNGIKAKTVRAMAPILKSADGYYMQQKQLEANIQELTRMLGRFAPRK
jgi:DNA-binding helix-hairpin-helix protein with protein kinase domain